LVSSFGFWRAVSNICVCEARLPAALNSACERVGLMIDTRKQIWFKGLLYAIQKGFLKKGVDKGKDSGD
jgi:hypothetical protein